MLVHREQPREAEDASPVPPIGIPPGNSAPSAATIPSADRSPSVTVRADSAADTRSPTLGSRRSSDPAKPSSKICRYPAPVSVSGMSTPTPMAVIVGDAGRVDRYADAERVHREDAEVDAETEVDLDVERVGAGDPCAEDLDEVVGGVARATGSTRSEPESARSIV